MRIRDDIRSVVMEGLTLCLDSGVTYLYLCFVKYGTFYGLVREMKVGGVAHPRLSVTILSTNVSKGGLAASAQRTRDTVPIQPTSPALVLLCSGAINLHLCTPEIHSIILCFVYIFSCSFRIDLVEAQKKRHKFEA